VDAGAVLELMDGEDGDGGGEKKAPHVPDGGKEGGVKDGAEGKVESGDGESKGSGNGGEVPLIGTMEIGGL
jgi:hypothetical protein